jgi:hypothetical protein
MSGCNRLSGSHAIIAFNSYCDIVLLSRGRSGSLSRVCKPSTDFNRIAFVEAEETLCRIAEMKHSGEIQRTRSGWDGPLRLPGLRVDIVRSA